MGPKIASSRKDTKVSKKDFKSNKTSSKAVSPKGWPSGISYIRRPAYSKQLAPEVLTALNTPATTSPTIIKSAAPYSNVRITPISSPTHPAHNQHGLFAAQSLQPNTLILPYLGYVHGKAEEDPASDYDLSLDRELGIGVDATRIGNEARFINDYRGVGPPVPNAEFRGVWLDVGGGAVEKVMAVYVLSAGKSGKGARARGIKSGEEVLVSYGKGFWDERKGEE
ncbi:uncharacterized protein BDZ99DRAFT_63488 [Mytilinidion resinicola]|uniref:SET domain-containing protein n=1 Tax=Mytilinidion resinicola TaxID=574789 RepID=A0A6A6YG55_9PEZI|nr:uncharacterized protein BDZ99DRAFT_63488 [Mytilinidion resinicola]KAF2807720.1 hypothetical protein BDZ99DRAFT_63488 [Mytilinidion resinicola]